MISFKFDIDKTIQITDYLLKKFNGKVNYTKLIKMLYIADKEALKSYGFTISNDKYYSLPKGPILSNLYYLIQDTIRGDIKEEQLFYWKTFFQKDGYDIKHVNKNDLSYTKLCKADKKILDKIFEEHKDKSFTELIELTHNKELFPEVKWEQAEAAETPDEKNIPITIEEILKSVGVSNEEIELIAAENIAQNKNAEFISLNLV